ncbi:MAG: hypothetical protein ACREQ9_14945 [Candidatus Binatia bacterium]
MRASFGIVCLLLLAVTSIPACGRKADPQPADLVRPRTIRTLAANFAPEGVRLTWGRPNEYVNGKRMDDLGGFLVFRGRPGEQAEELASVPVSDRERFQREKRFEYLDQGAAKGESYYYRVVSFTTDGYYSEPSNQVSVRIAP